MSRSGLTLTYAICP